MKYQLMKNLQLISKSKKLDIHLLIYNFNKNYHFSLEMSYLNLLHPDYNQILSIYKHADIILLLLIQ